MAQRFSEEEANLIMVNVGARPAYLSSTRPVDSNLVSLYPNVAEYSYVGKNTGRRFYIYYDTRIANIDKYLERVATLSAGKTMGELLGYLQPGIKNTNTHFLKWYLNRTHLYTEALIPSSEIEAIRATRQALLPPGYVLTTEMTLKKAESKGRPSIMAKMATLPTNWSTKDLMKGVVFLGLDNEVTWSPLGKKQPSKGDWVWAVPETAAFVAYFYKLRSQGFVPIMWTLKTDGFAEEVAAAAKNSGEEPLIIVKGYTPTQLQAWIVSQDNQIWGISTSGTPLHHCGLPPNFPVYTINAVPSSTNYTLEHLGFTVEKRLPTTSCLLILMGQPGSGKSTVAAKLQALGWLVYDEITAGKLRKGQKKLTADFRQRLVEVKEGKLKGVVIDATNPTVAMRQIYRAVAIEMGVFAYTGWITRPGWTSNEARTVGKVPPIAMNMYVSRLEPPGLNEPYIRLV